MYLDDCKYKRGKKQYRRVLLRENVKIGKNKYKQDTLANLSHCSDEEIESIKIALKYKNNLSYLKKLTKGSFENGKIVGPTSVLYQLSNKLKITQALGNCEEARLILWLIISRVIFQGSRSSAVREANIHAACEILRLKPFNEEDLYKAMDWLYKNQSKIEKKLFKNKKRENSGENLYLYDVSSSYLEGQCNELAEYGYNRDKKIGKKQIVFGLLTDSSGDPISIEAFKGNTKDNKTLISQIRKLKDKFGCKYITIVGDKGMIKQLQIEEIEKISQDQTNDCIIKYITSITKPQIIGLMNRNVIQLGLFDNELCEVLDNDIRYVLRRNPIRLKEMAANRKEKIEYFQDLVSKCNKYLLEHPKAHLETQETRLNIVLKRLKLNYFMSLELNYSQRNINFILDENKLSEYSKLDGCYVIKTNLLEDSISKEVIHSRYKELSKVEKAFRVSKTEHLKLRPIYVRKKEKTAAHLFIVMLAYKLVLYLKFAWKDINLTVSECIGELSKSSSIIITIGNSKLNRVQKPDKRIKRLLDKLDMKLPTILPYFDFKILTRKNLKKSRKK